MDKFHESVLLAEAIEFLRVRPGGKYIDATAGGGGHTKAILEKGGEVLALDRDPEAIEYLKSRNLKNLTLKQGNFSHIYTIAKASGFEEISGVLFDLGVSSHQLETPQRGFSFARNGPLDMRMDPEIQIKAYDLINHLDQRRLNEIFETYGQEKLSRAISSAICSARQIKPIGQTQQLSEIVRKVYAKKHIKNKLNPATKVFQALRIVVNSELLNLEESLPQAVDLLKKGGRLVVISFHSLEDGKVKRFFKQEKRLKLITQKPIGPQDLEIQRNPRSRSAKLRAAEKI